MVKHLTRTGNSLALLLPKPILEMMGADEKTPVQLRLEGRELIVSVVHEDDRKKFLAAAEKSHKRYAKAYKRLAE
jgi:antitoxin component of MazEF toxin-antitoxin module